MHRKSSIIGAVLSGILLPSIARAAAMPPIMCDLFPGCGDAPSNVAVDIVIPKITELLLNTSAALALIFVIIGGGRYLLSFGRDEEHGKAFKTILWACIGLIVALAAHRIVTLVMTEQYVVAGQNPLFSFFQSVVRIMITLLNTAFFIVIVYGGFRMVEARGRDEEVSKGRKAIIYSIIGVMIINIAPVIVKNLTKLW